MDSLRYVLTVDRQEVELWIKAPKECEVLKGGTLKCHQNTLSTAHQLLLKLVGHVHQMRPKENTYPND